MPAKALIADDDPMIREILSDLLTSMDFEIQESATGAQTLARAKAEDFDVILLDLHFPDCRDLSTLESLRKERPGTDVILVTAETEDMNLVVQATRLGAFDYVPKPIREDDIRIRVTRVMEWRKLHQTHARVVEELTRGQEIQDLIGNCLAMQGLKEKILGLADYDVPVLVLGETGTGKELVARALHNSGNRRGQPFVAVNCAALPETLTESELFGHERGAFTGAHTAKKGAFEETGSGTLFLDEIGDMSAQAQATLLRVLETGTYRSVGGKEKTSSARVVFATNQNLEELVTDGRFRKDLLYRINRITLRMLPLRERREDIMLLARHFLAQFERKIGKGIIEFSPNVVDCLQNYGWPGNVRELRNEIERAYIFAAGSQLQALDFSPEILIPRGETPEGDEKAPANLNELYQLVEALRNTGGNISKAAESLGVHRNTVHRWLRKYSIET